MRVERVSERAVILRDLGCTAFELARGLNLTISSPGHDVMVSDCGQQFRLDQGDAVLVEAVASYETVGLYFSGAIVGLDRLQEAIAAVIGSLDRSSSPEPKLIEIPVCYELGPELSVSASALGLAPEELIAIHQAGCYQCYAVGFAPGFAYLGYLDDRIATLPRLGSPRPRVEPGSVGITGRQTAVYPSGTPGGWNLIGRCPLTLVSVEDAYFPIEAGDQVRFTRIDVAEFGRLKGERL